MTWISSKTIKGSFVSFKADSILLAISSVDILDFIYIVSLGAVLYRTGMGYFPLSMSVFLSMI